MKTKQDLLDKMKSLGACLEATEYVQTSKSKTASTIWAKCDQVDWLCWFAFRVRPDLASAFVLKQADMAVRVHVVAALQAAGAAYLAYLAGAAYLAVAAYLAEYSAHSSQLKELHALWPQIAEAAGEKRSVKP